MGALGLHPHVRRGGAALGFQIRAWSIVRVSLQKAIAAGAAVLVIMARICRALLWPVCRSCNDSLRGTSYHKSDSQVGVHWDRRQSGIIVKHVPLDGDVESKQVLIDWLIN